MGGALEELSWTILQRGWGNLEAPHLKLLGISACGQGGEKQLPSKPLAREVIPGNKNTTPWGAGYTQMGHVLSGS